MRRVVYTVWILGDGDIFKGYNNTFVSSHLDKRAATIIADNQSGIIEEEYELLHESYIEQLEKADAEILRVQQGARNMLAYGG